MAADDSEHQNCDKDRYHQVLTEVDYPEQADVYNGHDSAPLVYPVSAMVYLGYYQGAPCNDSQVMPKEKLVERDITDSAPK